ncbi:MAG: Stealth CR1 domain-containing protein, partial [Muribaculaceae bacterium]|nr:Stealth CR1 domain-containing protein [Muribaculaceae bacterium]
MGKKYITMEKIDFVLIWVDDNDLVWQDSLRKYTQLESGDARPVRFRDWGTLRYWFRGVEKFAPW